MRITSVTPMKNEAPYLLEWVAYHRMIGVNDILVFSNDCRDGTDLMLERLDEMGVLRHYPNPSMFTGSTKHHLQVIRYINSGQRLRRSDWVVHLDVDEFICVHPGAGKLADLFAALPDANMIVMNQLNFGSGGLDRFEDGLQIDRSRYCWALTGPYHPKVDRRGTKTLTHASAGAKSWNNHSPVFPRDGVGRVRPVNGSGVPLEIDLTRDLKSLVAPHYGFDVVQLNHYPLRSVEGFLLKADRGNANHADPGDLMAYWRRYDRNDREETAILRHVDAVATARDELLQDAELRSLHTAAMEHAGARIRELLQTPEMADLKARIEKFRKRNPGLAEAA